MKCSEVKCSLVFRFISSAIITRYIIAMASNKDIVIVDLVSSESEEEVEIIAEYRYEEDLLVTEEPVEVICEPDMQGRGQTGTRGRGRRRRRRQPTPVSTSADSSIVSLPEEGRTGLRERTDKVLKDITSSSSSSTSSSTDEDFTQPPKKEARRVITPGSGQME